MSTTHTYTHARTHTHTHAHTHTHTHTHTHMHAHTHTRTHTHTELPSSPKLAIYFPPLIDGSDVKTCWLPSIDRGGRDDFHYNIYALELGSNEFKRINKEEILPSNEDQNDEDPICYTLSVERERSSFTIVVVATNGAANDPNTINDISIVQDRFIAFYIATCPGSLPPS